MRVLLLTVVLGALSGAVNVAFARSGPTAEAINEERVLRHVDQLVRTIGPRPAGSAAARRAADYIFAELALVGLAPERIAVGTIDTPGIRVGSMQFRRAQTLHYRDANILVRFAPPTANPGKAILLMAHYDSVPAAPGAIDNAVSVGILLEVARVLARAPASRPIFIAFTAAEEVGLAGARRLALSLGDQVGLAVALDLLGISETITLNGLSSLLGVSWLHLLAAIAHLADVPVRAPLPHRVVSRLLPQLERSDHGPFTERGIPAFHLYNREIYLPYHTRWDTQQHVRRASIANAGAFLLALTRFIGPLPQTGGDQGFWLPLGTKGRVVTALTIKLIAIALGVFAITTVVMIIRSARGAGKGAGLLLSLPAYAGGWLTATGVLELDERLTLHDFPWAHAPLRYVLASTAIAGAVAIALLWLASTRWHLAGSRRYLVAAIALPLLAGAGLLFLGAHELAWLPLVAAAALAAMHWTQARWSASLWLALATLPALVPLGPAFLREAVFHGFLGAAMPLTVLPALLLLYPSLGALYVLTRFSGAPTFTRVRARALAAALGGAVVAATLAIVLLAPPCSPSIVDAYGLSCEIVPRH